MEFDPETRVLETVPIVSTPGMLGGKPHVAGRRISVQLIAEYYLAGETPERICRAFKLTLAEVFAALSSYYENKNEIDAAMREDSVEIERLIAEGEILPAIDDSLDKVISAAAAAQIYHLAPRTVRDAIEQGKIEAIKSGGTWLLRRADAEARWGERRRGLAAES